MRTLIDGCRVAALCDVSLATLYRRLLSDPTFPRPIRFSRRHVRWDEAEVQTWLASQ
jgi:predicted DNA-binding transcriptional regulator AlpA